MLITNITMDSHKYDYLFKFVLVGDSTVGKSALMHRFTEDVFSEQINSTIGIDFKIRTIEINDKKIKLQIWDTAGQERFRTITTAYYRGAHGIIVVYDVTKRQTFDHVPQWFTMVSQFATDSVQLLLVGNKVDLEDQRHVTVKDGQAMAQKYNVNFVECSAKENLQVHHIFITMASRLLQNVIGMITTKPSLPITSHIYPFEERHDHTPPQTKKCC